MSDLFQNSDLAASAPRPLADRLRPAQLADVVGQDHVVGAEAPLGRMIGQGRMASLILWGPPGTGKTTIARLLADHADLHFEQISAIFSGVADLRKVFEKAKAARMAGKGTLLFVDEIHRFNKAQQDSFLPHVEDGTITLIGATTENPSFELNGALLSRCQVLVLERLSEDALGLLLDRAAEDMGTALPLSDDGRATLFRLADGDGRFFLNLVEELYALGGDGPLGAAEVAAALNQRAPLYDKSDEGHYNLISALHKAVRGSDVDGALYWLARMLTAGEDPLYLLRRLVRMASEDIGLADPQALAQTLAAKDAYDFLGSPEGELAIAQATLYLATAPKSNAAYVAYKGAVAAAKETGSLMPPKHALNAPTKMMKDQGYSDGYVYDPDTPDGFAGQNYFPADMGRRQFYAPGERGFEREVVKRLQYWQRLREELNQ
ncbi:MAG: replication-associated recombination protein A [Alphaproteobacteria bacterium]